MKKIFIIIGFCTYIFANPLEFETLVSNFVQNIESEGSKITYKGNFVANKQKAYWHYETPNLKNIYFSHEKVVIIEPQLEQAIITNLKNTPNLTDILSSANKNSQGIYEANFDGIKYQIEIENNLPVSIKYTDKLDNKITISLSQTKKNEVINTEILQPIIPQNYDIVTQ